MIAGEEINNPHVILETELIVRESCGAGLARPAPASKIGGERY
jgi:hypothetical protein